MRNAKTEELLLISEYCDEILELIENQVRDDENSLTTSDLQASIESIIYKIGRDKELAALVQE